MDKNALFKKLKQTIVEGDSEQLCALVRGAIDKLPPLDMIQQGMMPGMQEIGDKFSAGEVFLPELLMATGGSAVARPYSTPCRMPSGSNSVYRV